MRVLLTLATLSGAISGSAALLPVVASDFLSVNGAEPLDPLDLVVEPQALGCRQRFLRRRSNRFLHLLPLSSPSRS